MTDRLLIEGLQLFGHHGVGAQERERGQIFSLDIELEFAFSSRDDLTQTIDYVQVLETVQRVNAAHSFQLLESFAQAAATEVLEGFSAARRVRIRVCKQRPPLPAGIFVDRISAEVIQIREG